MSLTLQDSAAPNSLSELLYEAAKLGSMLEALAEKPSIEAICDEMTSQMHEKGGDWTPDPGDTMFICDWIDAVMPQLISCYSVFDRYSQPMIRMRLEGFMRPNGLSMTEFTVPQIFQYLDDEVVKRLLPSDEEVAEAEATNEHLEKIDQGLLEPDLTDAPDPRVQDAEAINEAELADAAHAEQQAEGSWL